MSGNLRVAEIADIDAMHRVRLAVHENALSDPRRVRSEHYRAMIRTDGRGWVYEAEGVVVGFSFADRSRRSIWALFVAPEFVGRGIGRRLLDSATAWLFELGGEPVWLTTEPGTRAALFYTAAGWRQTSIEASGELRFELAISESGGKI